MSVLLDWYCRGWDWIEDEFGVSSHLWLCNPFENFLQVGTADVDGMLEVLIFVLSDGLIHDDKTANVDVVEVKVDLCLVKILKVSLGI